jgi:hypothetical protein
VDGHLNQLKPFGDYLWESLLRAELKSMSRDGKEREVQADLQGQHHYHPRRTRFTPENIRQIVNLLERGKSKEQIAETIGVTVGTLQVTCSKLGISLRQPRFNTGTGMLRRRRLQREDQLSLAVQSQARGVAHNDKNEQDQLPLNEAAVKLSEPASCQRACETGGTASMNFAIKMLYKGQQKRANWR